jgi:hypothetical protein
MSNRGRRRPFQVIIWGLVVVAAVVVATLLVLVGMGVLVLSSNSSPSPVTVTSVHVQIAQGMTPSGTPWFGQTWVNLTTPAQGYPYQVSPGQSWSVGLLLVNFDNATHTVYRVTASPPFTVAGTHPGVPCAFPGGSDEGTFLVYVTAPSTPGVTYSVNLLVSAYASG